MGGPINFKALALRGRFFGEAEVLSCELFMRIAYAIRMGGPINFKALALRACGLFPWPAYVSKLPTLSMKKAHTAKL
jgi:hypothetical protein